MVATDQSQQQVSNARPHSKITYKVAPAEATGLPACSTDLVTCATGLHWCEEWCSLGHQCAGLSYLSWVIDTQISAVTQLTLYQGQQGLADLHQSLAQTGPCAGQTWRPHMRRRSGS